MVVGMSLDRVADLQRWQDSGAHWRVLTRTVDSLTISLLRCDGGEEVDRNTSSDPRLLEFVGTSTASDDDI